MSRINGTNTDIKYDELTMSFGIELGTDAPVSAEEVMAHLRTMRSRTRKRFAHIHLKVEEAGQVIIIKLREFVDFLELDLLDALRQLFTQKGLVCA